MNQIKLNTYLLRFKEKYAAGNKFLVLGTILKDPPKKKDEEDKVYSDEKVDFLKIFESFIKVFDKGFVGVKSQNRAMRLGKNLTFNRKTKEISGFFSAGFTGEQREVWQPSKIDKSVFTIEKGFVNASRYYFRIKFPSNKAEGLLIVQGTSAESAGDLFKMLLLQFLAKEFKDIYSVKISRYTSKKDLANFKKNSKVTSIMLTKNKYPKDSVENILGVDIAQGDVRLKIVLEGEFNQVMIGKKLKELNTKIIAKASKFFTSETLDSLDLNVTSDYSTNLKLYDKALDKSAVAKSGSGFEIKPFTYISEEKIKRETKTNLPTEASLKKAVDDYFKEIENEL